MKSSCTCILIAEIYFRCGVYHLRNRSRGWHSLSWLAMSARQKEIMPKKKKPLQWDQSLDFLHDPRKGTGKRWSSQKH